MWATITKTMEFQKHNQNKIQEFLTLQNHAAYYYEKMADITTEKHLKRIFIAIANHHKKARLSLMKATFPNQNKFQSVIQEGKSLIGIMRKKILNTLFFNDKSEISVLCLKTEIRLLDELELFFNHNKFNKEVTQCLIDYDNSIRTYLKRLKKLPDMKKHPIRKTG